MLPAWEATRLTRDHSSIAPRPSSGHRWAAALSLFGLAAAIALFVWLVLSSRWGSLVVLAVALGVAVAALWVAVSRSGWRRVVAMGLIIAAAVVMALVVTENSQVLAVIVFFALWPISASLARYALRVDPRSLVAAPIAGTEVGSLSQPAVIMNPRSGGGKVEQFDLVEEARRRGLEPVVLQPGDDLVQLAQDAVAAGADGLGAAGGDGTQALVADIAAEHDLPFVCIPAGTRNHFALDLGLDRDDVVGALDAFGDAVERRVDLAAVNGRIFVNNCSLGVYARIVQSDEYRDAKVETSATMLPEMLGPDADPIDLRFTDGRGRERRSTQMLLVSNNPYALDRLGGFGTRARMDSGRLGLVDVQINRPADLNAFVALQAAGRASSFGGWVEWTAVRFEVDSGGPVEIGVDGEALQMEPPLVFDSRPGALRVRLPHHAPGRAPAAVAVNLDRATLRALGAVAAGRPPTEPVPTAARPD